VAAFSGSRRCLRAAGQVVRDDRRGDIRHGARCHTFTGCELCDVRADPGRDASLLCIVETPADQSAMECTGSYRGLYFVLRGRLSPLHGVGVHDIGIGPLLERRERGPVSEIILATSFTAEGEATSHVLGEALEARAGSPSPGSRAAFQRNLAGLEVANQFGHDGMDRFPVAALCFEERCAAGIP
jgi:hypothetical protein